MNKVFIFVFFCVRFNNSFYLCNRKMENVFKVASYKYYKDSFQTVMFLLSPHSLCGDPKM